MMKKVIIYLLLVIPLMFFSCNNDESNNEDELKDKDKKENISKDVETINLSDKSIPVKLTVPKGSKVEEGIMSNNGGEFSIYNYEINNDDWSMDITMTDEEPYADMETYIHNEKQTVKQSGEFEEFVKETDNGFIYKLSTEEGDDYNFYLVKFKNNRAIEFTSGLMFKNLSLEEVENIFKTANSAE